LQAPVLGSDLGESDVAVATEGAHCFGLLEFGRQCSFAKDSASNSGVEFHRLAEGRSESVNCGPIIQPFPNAAAHHGSYSGGQEATAGAALEFRNRFATFSAMSLCWH
jgi:hypothetical protein